MGDKIRAFIAISLPESVLRSIGKAQESLRRSRLDIKWVRPTGIHLTLKFLGDVDRTNIEKIQAAIGRAAERSTPFTLNGEGVGVFPDRKRPRVIWVGMSGDLQALAALHRDLEAQLKGLGFPREKRPFRGHLTMGRVKGRVDAIELGKAMEGLNAFKTESFCVESVDLFQSTLRPDGAVYDRLAQLPLQAPKVEDAQS